MKILGADERLAQKSGAKILIIGLSGVGKTSLLRTLDQAMLSSTLFVDIEAGDIAVADLPVASVRPRRWEDCRDVACILGGANPALPPTACYSEAHYKHVAENAELARLASFQVLFVDSLTAASRLSLTWAEQQPEAITDRGRKDLRAIYGLHARQLIGWLNQLCAFVCTSPNPWGYPAKDRSGRLEQLEPPDLGKLIAKLIPVAGSPAKAA
jgi:energy-coupling factor transporter ATP-binding protein EcfA2